MAFDAVMGNVIAERRESIGMSQTILAQRMSEAGHRWHQPTVVRVETGRRPVRASELAALATTLRLELRDLFSGQTGDLPREWPRTSRLSPEVEVVSDYRGVRWRQISLDRWQSEEGTFIAPFWFLAETWGPLREVPS